MADDHEIVSELLAEIERRASLAPDAPAGAVILRVLAENEITTRTVQGRRTTVAFCRELGRRLDFPELIQLAASVERMEAEL